MLTTVVTTNKSCHICKCDLVAYLPETVVYPQGKGEPEGPVRVHHSCLDWSPITGTKGESL